MRLSVFLTALLFFACTADKTTFLNEKKVIDGLEDSVDIIRDQWGINHIYAQNQRDLFFAQGYAAAHDRLFQFEIWRRQATGTVAEILGVKELNRDIGTRLFKYRGDKNIIIKRTNIDIKLNTMYVFKSKDTSLFRHNKILTYRST